MTTLTILNWRIWKIGVGSCTLHAAAVLILLTYLLPPSAECRPQGVPLYQVLDNSQMTWIPLKNGDHEGGFFAVGAPPLKVNLLKVFFDRVNLLAKLPVDSIRRLLVPKKGRAGYSVIDLETGSVIGDVDTTMTTN